VHLLTFAQTQEFFSFQSRFSRWMSYLRRVKKVFQTGLDFTVDKLTNSIENVVTGDSFPTDISLLSFSELKNISKKGGWQFNWKSEFQEPARDVFKLSIVNNQNVIQGLISLELKTDHVYLVAFACKLSFQRGFDGNVSFLSKSQLVNHYIESLGAKHFGGRLMIIDTFAALKLINKYFPL
jgi:hypothetical protein